MPSSLHNPSSEPAGHEVETALFAPLRLGHHLLSSRIVMAPLTRFRTEDTTHVPLPFVQDYYVQRASTPGTLLISEGTLVSARGGGWSNVPGIWSREQIAAWKQIVDGVHAAGGVFFMQLFAVGRTADAESLTRESGGKWKVKGPSAIAVDEGPVPEELSEEEICDLVADFAQAARNAVEGAGFDGVEVHGANGYLIDQFTQDTANRRIDGWGGDVERRARFALEVTKAVAAAVGREKVGVRLSPFSDFQGMGMQDPVPQFVYLIEELKKLGLAYLHLVESRISGAIEGGQQGSLRPFTDAWGKTSTILLAGGYTSESARRAVDQEYPDQDIAIVFGRQFLASPDLVFRFQHGIAPNEYDRKLFYSLKNKQGYIDYPFSSEFLNRESGEAAAV